MSGRVHEELRKTQSAEEEKMFRWRPSAAIEINMEGREPEGIVKKEEYHKIRELIIKELFKVKDPENGRNIVRKGRGTHRMNGIFIAYGPDIKDTGESIGRARIIDLAPYDSTHV